MSKKHFCLLVMDTILLLGLMAVGAAAVLGHTIALPLGIAGAILVLAYLVHS